MKDDLRRRAESLAGRFTTDPSLVGVLTADESRLLHDLQVHQIELEIQNEELRRTETALETARARYFDLYDLAPIGYVTIGAHFVVIEANLTAARLLEVERAALVGAPLTRFLEPDDQDTFYLHQRRLVATRTPQVCEVRMRRGPEGWFWARIESVVAAGAAGGADVCRAVVSDITDSRRHATERQQFERARQQTLKAESLGRMAGAVAHHFNNQLAVVMGNIEAALADPDLANDCLTDALRAVDRAAAISGLLLTSLGQRAGRQAPLDLSVALLESIQHIRETLPSHVTLELDFPSPGPPVAANAEQLRLLLSNLLTNAWEAVGDLPSTIQVRVQTVDGAEIPREHRFPPAWTPQSGPHACIEVVDPGAGFDDDAIERAFEPFYSSKFAGRGLGLPVVLGILGAHQGGLVVDSRRTAARGTTFRVYLPLWDTSSTFGPSPPAADQ